MLKLHFHHFLISTIICGYDINGCYSGELGPHSWGSPTHPPSVFDTFCSNSRTLSVMQSRIFQPEDSTILVIHHPWSKRFFLQWRLQQLILAGILFLSRFQYKKWGKLESLSGRRWSKVCRPFLSNSFLNTVYKILLKLQMKVKTSDLQKAMIDLNMTCINKTCNWFEEKKQENKLAAWAGVWCIGEIFHK